MSVARFRVIGRLDRAGGTCEGTVVIDRQTGVVVIRPLNARAASRVFTTTLAGMADMAVARLIQVREREKREARRAKRRGRR